MNYELEAIRGPIKPLKLESKRLRDRKSAPGNFQAIPADPSLDAHTEHRGNPFWKRPVGRDIKLRGSTIPVVERSSSSAGVNSELKIGVWSCVAQWTQDKCPNAV
ncbi:predicted protein [Histoplasma capsulatum H143]|uniref:Uncharacterized protein n=1 Tax=Ajellomyces capsulatus (strain H143) TaxID=544712 RepID=C6HIJ7_AJECH|nr:predicted protein [Histoplasma capsulatum H143]